MCEPRGLGYLVLTLVAVYIEIGLAQDFGYDGTEGPKFWGNKYHQCFGKHQSPINIEEHDVEAVNLFPMIFKNFDKSPSSGMLTNNGHTVLLTINERNFKPTITGGPLIGNYEFSQLHFHWGSKDTEGSENRINNSSFPMELHMVFFSSSYGTYEEATSHPDGITVLAFLYDASEKPNKNYFLLVEALPKVVNVGSKTTLEKVPPFEDLLVSNRSTYFTYGGSLTTPPCSEVVTWIEFRNTIPLSHGQIEVFRQLNSNHGKISHNFRPPQPLHGRVIRMNRNIDIYRYEHEMNLESKNAGVTFKPVLRNLLLCALTFLHFLLLF